MLRTTFLFLLMVLFAAACRPSEQQMVFSATLRPAQSPTSVAQSVTLVPTAHPIPTRTSTALPTSTFTPTFTPTDTPTPSNTPTPTDTTTPIAINSPTPSGTEEVIGTPLPTWTPPPIDPAVTIADHYHFRRPIGEGATSNWADRTYPYGGTQGGRLQVHHGVDIVNPRGVPVLAAADGTVFYAGDDLTTMYGPINNYYGRLVVIRHDFAAPDGQPVFTLYGHLGRWEVETGQRVSAGDVIGQVGDAGVAQGPHLHFEVREGDPQNFGNTRNPELWIYPFQGFGTLAGRVTDADGNALYDVTLQVRSSDLNRNAFSYADSSVNPDTVFGENFTLGDLPANYYEVTVRADNRLRFQKMIYLYPNRTTWIDVKLNR
jgi:murein DD-endopeptidase MepM/ murein hydrolase activator NlpD